MYVYFIRCYHLRLNTFDDIANTQCLTTDQTIFLSAWVLVTWICLGKQDGRWSLLPPPKRCIFLVYYSQHFFQKHLSASMGQPQRTTTHDEVRETWPQWQNRLYNLFGVNHTKLAIAGVEPSTSRLPYWRSANWAIKPSRPVTPTMLSFQTGEMSTF